MTTPIPVAEVLSVIGEAFARDADGNTRPLKAGDKLNAGEVVVTSGGASVQLDFGNGETMMVGENQSVTMTTELSSLTAPDATEAAITDPTVADVLAALEGEGDLLDELDATAAGAGAGGGGDGEGGGFVSLARVDETTEGVGYGFDAPEGGITLLSEDVLPDDEEEILPPGDDDDEQPGDDDDDEQPGDDDDDEQPGDDDDDEQPGDDDDDEQPGDDDDDEQPSEPFDSFASSGEAYKAWESNGNTQQFNQYEVINTDDGYGVKQTTGKPAGRTDQLDNNETLLFSFHDEWSQIDFTITAHDGGTDAAGVVIAYDSGRNEIGRYEFSGEGTYTLSTEGAEISHMVVNGTASGNSDGFYIDFTLTNAMTGDTYDSSTDSWGSVVADGDDFGDENVDIQAE